MSISTGLAMKKRTSDLSRSISSRTLGSVPVFLACKSSPRTPVTLRLCSRTASRPSRSSSRILLAPSAMARRIASVSPASSLCCKGGVPSKMAEPGQFLGNGLRNEDATVSRLEKFKLVNDRKIGNGRRIAHDEQPCLTPHPTPSTRRNQPLNFFQVLHEEHSLLS